MIVYVSPLHVRLNMQCDDHLGIDHTEADAVLRMLKTNVGQPVEPKFGMCFHSWAEADTFVRMFGARTVPFRLHNGGGARSKVYVCKHPNQSIFCKRCKTSEDDGEAIEGEGFRGRGGRRGGSGDKCEQSRLVKQILEAQDRGLCHAVVQVSMLMLNHVGSMLHSEYLFKL